MRSWDRRANLATISSNGYHKLCHNWPLSKRSWFLDGYYTDLGFLTHSKLLPAAGDAVPKGFCEKLNWWLPLLNLLWRPAYLGLVLNYSVPHYEREAWLWRVNFTITSFSVILRANEQSHKSRKIKLPPNLHLHVYKWINECGVSLLSETYRRIW
jgi:hypothetical protein